MHRLYLWNFKRQHQRPAWCDRLNDTTVVAQVSTPKLKIFEQGSVFTDHDFGCVHWKVSDA